MKHTKIISRKEKRSGKDADPLFHFAVSQSLICVLILLAAVVLRLVGGEAYAMVRSRYRDTFGDTTSVKEVTQPSDVLPDQEKDGNEAKDTNIPIQSQQAMSQEVLDQSFGDSIDDSMVLTKQSSVLIHTAVKHDNINEMAVPVQGVVTSPFGYRIHPIYGTRMFHNGVDIGADTGTPIASSLSGVVTASEYNSSYGNYVMVDHGNDLYTIYAHCDELLVKVGESVKKGETIARVGSTGVSTGPHLHFEVRRGEYRIDPAWLVDLS